MSNKKMVESIRKQKLLFLVESAFATLIMLTVPYMVGSEEAGNLIWDISEAFVAWSCSLTAIGYAKQYLNFNTNFRKLANEAIYPFYLLHQPVIVVVAYFMVQWEIAIIWKVLLITTTSFTLTVAIYWFLIRPFNILRFVFGLKTIKRENPAQSKILNPIQVIDNNKFYQSSFKNIDSPKTY
jgi:peptidoglycan/LPS O-acetylase OafA/YrhL